MIRKVLNYFFDRNKNKEILDRKDQVQELPKYNCIAPNCEFALSSLGKYSYISSGSKIHSTQIGSFCSIGPNVIIGYGEHPINFLSTSPLFYYGVQKFDVKIADTDYFDHHKKVIVKNDVWIGANVYIKNGVTIGNGAVIAAGAVVVSDVPDYNIYGGVPAKFIRLRFEQKIIDDLLEIEWWKLPILELKKYHQYFVSEDFNSFISEIKLKSSTNKYL